ncbi:type II membrane protein [Lobulomyces angularis]|nr:type II membrane protein [Lobulomyces angularis]
MKNKLSNFAIILILVFLASCNDCSEPITTEGKKFNLKNLDKEVQIVNELDTPPSKQKITYTVNPCDGLKKSTAIPDQDQCTEPGTKVCQVVSYSKGENKDFVSKVIPGGSSALNNLVDGNLCITFSGSKYGDAAQSTKITFTCADKYNDPTFEKYENNVLYLKWNTQEGCAEGADKPKENPKKDEEKKETGSEEHGQSVLGTFFLTLFILTLIYFIGGSIFNFLFRNSKLKLMKHFSNIFYKKQDFLSLSPTFKFGQISFTFLWISFFPFMSVLMVLM